MVEDETIFYKRGQLRKCKRVQCLLILITVFYQVKCALFYIENYAEIFLMHYAWKVAEKGFKITFKMNKLATIN
jgi:hypothetical protein